MNEKLVVIGCDHAGYLYKEMVKDYLIESGYTVVDKGTHSSKSVDYPDFIHPVADFIETGNCELGVLICGSGNGAAMTANKHQGIRAAVCWNEELAALARSHNDANALAIPARFVDYSTALSMVKVFLNTAFDGGRHTPRVQKIPLVTETGEEK